MEQDDNKNVEIWKAASGYEGLYEISDFGRLKNLKTGHITYGHKNQAGYMVSGLRKENKSKANLIHRIVAIAFIENHEQKPCVNHKNGLRHDNRVVNLEWVTVGENIVHGVRLRKEYGGPKYQLQEPQIAPPDEKTPEEWRQYWRERFTQLHYEHLEKRNKKLSGK